MAEQVQFNDLLKMTAYSGVGRQAGSSRQAGSGSRQVGTGTKMNWQGIHGNWPVKYCKTESGNR